MIGKYFRFVKPDPETQTGIFRVDRYERHIDDLYIVMKLVHSQSSRWVRKPGFEITILTTRFVRWWAESTPEDGWTQLTPLEVLTICS